MRSVLRRSTLVAGLVVALGASLSAAPVGRAAAQEDAASIVFAAGEVGQRQVFMVSADGSQRRQLTTGSNYKDEPTWSPDGSQVAFKAETPSGGQLFVIDVDGTGQRQLTDFPHGMVQEPAWSPDGSSIAFARIVGAQFTSLYVIGADGTGLRQLTRPEAARDSQPQWSPDGSRLVFIRLSDSPVDEDGYRDVVVVNVDGSGEQHLTDQAFASRAEWAPDGATIAYGVDGGAQFVITVARADGSAAGILPGNGVEPTWSPDSGQVAYLGFDDQPGRPLYASGPDGSGFRQVARAAGLDGRKAHNHLDWSADAAHLLYHDLQELFVVDADGGQPQHIATAGANVSDAFFSPGVVLRLAGPSRVETAAGVSRRVFSQADAVVLARADRYPDALAASPVAAGVGAPLLLTLSDRLHPSAAAEIQRLEAATAYLMGDQSALSAQVEHDLRAIGVGDVVRVAGANRYDTARLAATRVGGRSVYVVEGAHADPARGWPDAVSVSALAAFQQRPILLVERQRLPEETVLALRELGATAATIVGGTAAVSTEVADRIAAEGIAVERVAGATRYDTSRQVADRAVAAGMNPASTWFSSGGTWPDALSAGPAAGAQPGVLLLVDGTDLDAAPPARSWLDAHRAAFERITVVGGPDVVSPRVVVWVEQAVR